jgi:hypothetical protein
VADLDDLQTKLKAIADTVNTFKSESVQLRVVDVLLEQLGATRTFASPSVHLDRPARKSRRKAKKASAASAESKDKAPRKAARGSGSPGAFASISQLLGEGFFKTPRTIGAIVDHCASARGHHYKANECSPALLRLLRDEKLKRQKNKDGQYEYTQG